MKNESINLHLLAGQYICPYAFPLEYELLLQPGVQEEVGTWLEKVGFQLARVFDNDGAFFMAPLTLGQPHLNKARDDLLRYRDTYGPVILILELIRQTDMENPSFQAGDYVQVAQLETAISTSLSLENQMRSLLGVVKGLQRDVSNRVLLKRIMEFLRDEGMAILVNPKTDMYQLTGKVDQVHEVLAFISERTALGQDALNDQLPQESEESDLLSSSNPKDSNSASSADMGEWPHG